MQNLSTEGNHEVRIQGWIQRANGTYTLHGLYPHSLADYGIMSGNAQASNQNFQFLHSKNLQLAQSLKKSDIQNAKLIADISRMEKSLLDALARIESIERQNTNILERIEKILLFIPAFVSDISQWGVRILMGTPDNFAPRSLNMIECGGKK